MANLLSTTITGSITIPNASNDNRLYKGGNWVNPKDPWGNFHIQGGNSGEMYIDSAAYHIRNNTGGTEWLYINSSRLDVYVSQYTKYLRINQNWAGGDYGAEALTIRGTYPSITLRSTGNDSKWLIHHANGNPLQFYYGGTVDNNEWYKKIEFASDGNIWSAYYGDWLSNIFNSKQNASTAITTSNIGSQSVSYASSAGNADTLDGYHASSLTYVPIWTNNTQSAERSGFVSGGRWYRVANLGTERFFARVRIYDNSSGGPHASVEFQVSGAFNYSGSYSFTLTSNGYYSAPSVTQVRILSAGTYDPQFLEVYISYVGYAGSTFAVSLLEARNATVVNWEDGNIPSGYAATTWDANGPLATGGRAAIFNSGIYNTNDYSRFGNVLIGEGTYKNTIKPIGDVNLNILTASGAVYFDTYGQASGSFRAPIFYDSADTGYYLDPNGTSNLLQLTTATRARWNMPRIWYDRSSRTSDEGYWTGTNGWGVNDGTWADAWKGGFSGWDIWGTNTDHPQGAGGIHAQGIVSGQHYATSGVGYGWMMVGAHAATDNRYWLRGKWDTTTSGWVEMITTGNIGSQSVNYAVTSGTSSATTQTNFAELFIENVAVATKEFVTSQGYLTSLPSHTHDDRYLPIGGGWYGVNLPGSRWGGYAVNGGEIVFGRDIPNTSQMSILVDGAYLAGENNGFWSLPSDNDWNGRRGMSWNGTYLDFTTNSPTAQFTSLRLANGFTISQGASNYGVFNAWVNLSSTHGFYSSVNNAHLYPSDGTYGSWRIYGQRNGWGGLEFYDTSNGNISLMVNPNSNVTGFHNNSYGWQFKWENGTLYCSKNSYGGGTSATVLDSSNFSSWSQTKVYQGQSDGDWQNFTNDIGEFRVDEVLNITSGNHSNYPTGVYTYGGVMSWRGNNHSFQLYASHTGDLTFKTQWGNDNYSGWRNIIHSANIGSQSVSYATSAGNADTVDSLHASSFLRSDTYNSNYGGLQVHRNIGTIDGSWPDSDHTLSLENSDAGTIVVNFHRAGYTSNNLWYNGSQFRFDQVVTSTADFRAPIFYDSNDTGYYVDPNSISRLWGVAIRGDASSTGTSNQIFFWGTGDGTTSAIGFKANGGYFTNPTGFGDGYNTYFTMDSDGRGWVFRRGVGGSDFGAAYTSGWILNNGVWQANASMRAPIFYDSANTNRYLDLNSTAADAMVISGGIHISRDNVTGNGIILADDGDIVDLNDAYCSMRFSYGVRIFSANRGGTPVHTLHSDGNAYFNTSAQTPIFLVNSHSDNTKGYRIYNTSNSSVSAMFVNSSNQLVIAAGAVDQINLNKKVYVNGVALGVNVSPSATAGRIDASNDIVAYSSSDERLKHNITPIENALDKVKSLTGVEFDWKPEYKHAHGYEGHDTGIIAQQVQEVIPSAVRTNDTGFLAVRYEKLIGLLIEGMKEQQAQIDELKAKLDGLTK